jgi:hypothetical protein
MILPIRPKPRPIQWLRWYDAAANKTFTAIRWHGEDARACRNCPSCKAQHSADGRAMCVVEERGDVLTQPLAGMTG